MVAQNKQSFSKRFKKHRNGCWNFIGAINKAGYGVCGLNWKVVLAHRASWVLFVGTIPKGIFILHKCDNRKCVNPDHLFLGTAKDNTLDMIQKNRWKPRGKNKSTSKQKH